MPPPQIEHKLLFEDDVPELAFYVLGRLALSYLPHLIDAFEKKRVSVSIEIAEHLGVRHQPTRRDAKDKAPVEHMVEHRDIRGDRRRMIVRHIDGAGAELDAPGRIDERADEHHA